MFSEREKVIVSQKVIEFVSDPVDFTDVLTPVESLNFVFVPVLANQLLDYLSENNLVTYSVWAGDIFDGNTIIDASAVEKYVSSIDLGILVSKYAHAVLCPFTQESIDKAVKLCKDNTRIVESEYVG